MLAAISQPPPRRGDLPLGLILTRARPGTRPYNDQCRKAGGTHHEALRALGIPLVGILHGCLASRAASSETVASLGVDV